MSTSLLCLTFALGLLSGVALGAFFLFAPGREDVAEWRCVVTVSWVLVLSILGMAYELLR